MTDKNGSEWIDLTDLAPIPIWTHDVSAIDYGIVPVDRNAPLFNEKLVDLRSFGISGVSYYHIPDGTNPPYGQKINGSLPGLLARQGVADLLKSANLRLNRLGLELFVWDAYRPLATQKGVWDFWERETRKEDPQIDKKALYKKVTKFVSDPNQFEPEDSTTWPSHMSGASVDLTIRSTGNRRLLDMGAHFDQMDDSAFTDHYEKCLLRREIAADDPRLMNRRLLYNVMTDLGFTNYPKEFWHFDWGNQMHQLIKSHISGRRIEPAWYGIATLD